MANTSQSDIDALMGGLSEEDPTASPASTDAESSNEISAGGEDTKDLAAGQAKEVPPEDDFFIGTKKTAPKDTPSEDTSEAAPKDPRGTPWIDFYPEFTHKRPEELIERMKEELDNHRIQIENKELFKLRTLEVKIHRSYYLNWVHEANQLFINAVRIKTRMRRIEAKRKAGAKPAAK